MIKIRHSNYTTYYLNGIVHREDGPAIECDNGTKHWKINGLSHREDGPAIEFADGSTHWYQHNLLHRMDGPACDYNNGDKYWFRHGKYHREDGPAVDNGPNKYQCWYIDGKMLYDDEVKLHQQNRIKNIAFVLLSLERLPPYVIFWILEWSESAYISQLSQRSIIQMIEGIRNSKDKIRDNGPSGEET